MKRSNMEVKVSFLAGTSIEDACTEARDYAIRNNLAIVRFDFNGIKCGITQNCDVQLACSKFLKALETNSKIKFVVE